MGKKFFNNKEAVKLIDDLGNEFVKIKNPDYIHPEYEICPMAKKVNNVKERITAFVMDMDGTTTTTELLCLHSLEYMIRLFSGRTSKEEWAGLDHVNDYPHIIGNSTTKHVEYLINKYKGTFIQKNMQEAFIKAALWTLIKGKDEKRKEEVRNNVISLKLGEMLTDPLYRELTQNSAVQEITTAHLGRINASYGDKFDVSSFDNLVRAGIDVYYQRYHEILERIKKGEAGKVSDEIFSQPDIHLIEPMPGILIFLSIINGWVNEDETEYLLPQLLKDYKTRTGREFTLCTFEEVKNNLRRLAGIYRKDPAKTALVTSSIFYEADTVMNELMSILRAQLMCIEMPQKMKEFLCDRFSDYNNVYKSFITASDSSEIRLKPHRDLYSIALYKLNVSKDKFNTVAGFEDSESGTIAIRTAGIGLCVALPFAQTKGHDLTSASYICEGGLPEVLLTHKLFIQ
ncbi:MAG: hypothetical protein ACM3S2_17165 [Ignavibacteriales bacterium]